MSRVIASQYNREQYITGSIGGTVVVTVIYRQYFVTPSTITKISSITVWCETAGSGTLTLSLSGSSASRTITGSGWYTFTFSSPVTVTGSTGYNFYVTSGFTGRGPRCSMSGSGGYVSINGGAYTQTVYDDDSNATSFRSLAFYVSGYGKPQSLSGATVSNITHNSGYMQGSVSDDNGDTITDRGFAISTVGQPNALTYSISIGSGEGSFAGTYWGLASSQIYYVSTYATNSAGTSYSSYNYFYTLSPEAYITNSVNFVCGSNIPLTISNPANLWIGVILVVNGTSILARQLGQVTSGTITPTQEEIDAMYGKIPNTTSTSGYIRIHTYPNADYDIGEVVGENDKTLTMTINQTTNKPTFTDYTIANVDKNITNTDKYSNTLITSSTATLLGGSDKVIKGYSKVRATISVGNKAIALNSATMSNYRFIAGLLQANGVYSDNSDVNIDIDNVLVKDFSVTAIDSRSLSTSINKSLSYIAEYTPVSIWGVTLVRDNNIDTPVTMEFSGSFWKQYFGGGTSGVLNEVVCHWRYKESTEEWDTQVWTAITPTDDGNGNLTFSDYIEGDLGVNGFDRAKSYDIEVRLYDKLTNIIVNGVVNKGIPLMDWTKNGIALGEQYDPVEGGRFQVGGKSILNWFYPVGTIYETTSTDLDTTTKMDNHFGGTWEAYGSGRVLVAKSGDTEFDTIGETGGAKTHTLDLTQIPAHSHNVSTRFSTKNAGNYVAWFSGVAEGTWTETTASQGGGLAHNNLQPYVVVYRYRRTA